MSEAGIADTEIKHFMSCYVAKKLEGSDMQGTGQFIHLMKHTGKVIMSARTKEHWICPSTTRIMFEN